MVFKNEGLLKVWIWCLAKANHEPACVSINTGKGLSAVEIQPGQFIFGRKSAAKELDMNESTVYKRMQILKKAKNVTIQSNSHFSIISIVNWDTYQDKKNKSNRQSNRQVTGKEQASNTNNNDNNDNKKDIKDCSELSSDNSKQEAPVIYIPLVSKKTDPKEFPIYQKSVDEWMSAYPAVDIMYSLQKIRQWNLANPTKRKTDKGVMKHVNSWLSREQDKGGNRSYEDLKLFAEFD